MKKCLVAESLANFVFWFVFGMLLAIGSISSIPHLDPNLEIIIFGYLFPIIKASVVTILSSFGNYYSKLNKFDQDQTSTMISGWIAVGVIVCTLPQLYVVFRSANDYSFFINQYLPHEIIKKLSLATFHPLYLKTKLQVMNVLTPLINAIKCCKKEAVLPNGEQDKNPKGKRMTLILRESFNGVAGDILGRQMGEDVCMVVILAWMLPISQEYLFSSVPNTEIATNPFPTYSNILNMILGLAFTFETISTIIGFAALQRVGIPLIQNIKVIRMDAKHTGMNISALTGFLFVLAATYVY